MRHFPHPRENSFSLTTFISVGDEVVWSNSRGEAEDKAMKENGTYEPREYFTGMVVEVHEDHAIVDLGGELVRVDDPRKTYWFTKSPHQIVHAMGLPEINPGKLRDLMDFADTDIGLWYYLSRLTAGRPEVFEDVVNFILGPLAAALKAKSSDPAKGGTIYGFRDRETVVSHCALEIMFEAIALGLVPKSVRKELDAWMVSGMEEKLARVELDDLDPELRETLENLNEAEPRYAVLQLILVQAGMTWKIREIFYEKLSELLESVLAAAGVDIGAMVDKVLGDNPTQAEKAKEDPKLIGWIMGQVMKASPTKLDPNEVRAIIVERIG